MAKADSTVDDVEKIESPEEVDDESQDEIEEVEDDSTEVEDEQTDETNDDSEEESDDDSGDGDSEDDEEDDSDASFKKRYTQFKGDTPLEYIASLENGYKESSTEAVRLKHELDAEKKKNDKVAALIAANPELAEKLGDDTKDIALNPALLHAEEQLAKQMKSEYQEFVDDHPDLETDPALQKEVLDQMTAYSNAVKMTQRRQPSMKEALKFAWSSLGREDSKEEKLRMKAKDTAARTKNAKTTIKKKSDKVEFTQAQIAAGLKMGIGKDEKEVIKKFREFAGK